ncbi:MAG: molybdenum cofactor guanylyltransferase [Flavobacteriaceae bacterium]|nr:molybdenum cofactor guanylyltransferase [Flavobacteriaceae bacterium]
MNVSTNISAYILCGGKSSRMQTEKGLVTYLNKPFIQLVIEAILPITSNIFLVTDNQYYSSFGFPLIPDVYKEKGPVGGIYSALNHSDSDYNLLLSCDIPNITSSVIDNYLINNLSSDTDVSLLSDDSDSYPLIAIYNKRVESKFLEAINLNKLKLISLLAELNCQNIKVKKEDFNALKNINTKEDLRRIVKRENQLNTK